MRRVGKGRASVRLSRGSDRVWQHVPVVHPTGLYAQHLPVVPVGIEQRKLMRCQWRVEGLGREGGERGLLTLISKIFVFETGSMQNGNFRGKVPMQEAKIGVR